MQRFLTILYSLTLLLLISSCDDRIAPAVTDGNNIPTNGVKAGLLTSSVWQLEEVLNFRNDSTITAFSRSKNIGMSSAYSAQLYTFYNDNSLRISTNGLISAATWKLQQSDTQLEITDDKQLATLYTLNITSTELVLQNRFSRLTFKVKNSITSPSGDTTLTNIARKWIYEDITFTYLGKNYTAYRRGLSNNKILEVATHELVFGKEGSLTIIDEDNLSTLGTWELKNQARTLVQKLSDANIVSEDSYTVSLLTSKNFNYNKDINAAQRTPLDEAYLIWATKSGINVTQNSKINVAIKLIPKP